MTYCADMIVTRTPLRVSFAGGGTDLAEFYTNGHGGVLSTTIDKYVYVTVKRHGEIFGEPIRLNYSETEQVNRVEDIRNDIARECLRLLEIEPPIYISTVADVPAASGLGSSSAFAVGLLNALHVYKGERVSAGQLAEEAAHIEIDVLHGPIGKQDHFAAAFGGFSFLSFLADGGVSVEPQRFSNDGLKHLFEHLIVFWTGITREAASVLGEQRRNTAERVAELTAMRDCARQMQEALRRGFVPEEFGRALTASWEIKRQLASGVSNGRIDRWYDLAMEAGACGGKLCGAGGGGFLLFVVRPERREQVRHALRDLTVIPLGYEPQGSRVLMPAAAWS